MIVPMPHGQTPQTGVLLVNLGTPTAPTAQAVRTYLKEFLSDPRVVDLPRWLWLPILYGAILPLRPAAAAKKYAEIWMAGGSPLRVYTQNAAAALAERLAGTAQVDWAMRYGAPSVAERLASMRASGCARILVVPMYPQYSRSTSASVADAVAEAIAQTPGAAPDIKIAATFFDDPAYIGALKSLATQNLAALSWAPERVILSFHGAPKRWSADGDPYEEQCKATARLLRDAMGWSAEFAPLAFQSRFGREEWLSPATDATINELAAAGVKNLAVMTPGFVADCLETLEEIAIAGAEAFKQAGGEQFTALPCLNATPAMIAALDTLARRECADWK